MSEVERCLRRQIMHADLKCLGRGRGEVGATRDAIRQSPRFALSSPHHVLPL